MTAALLHIAVESAAGWLLLAVVYAIGWAANGIAHDYHELRQLDAAEQHARRTPEPVRLTLVAGERPELFDQDAVA